MTAPAAPLEKAVEEAGVALADHETRWPPYCACTSCVALRSLLAALDAERGEAEAALMEIRDSPTAMGKDIARRYFARREEKEVPE